MATYYWREVVTRTRAILDLIDGLNVPSGVPRSIDVRTECPTALVLLAAMRRQRNGGNSVLENRTIEIQVYLGGYTEGLEFEAETRAYAEDLFEKIYDQFDGRRRLQIIVSPAVADNGIAADALVTIDDGLQQLTYPAGTENRFLGFIARLNVIREFVTEQKA